MLIDFICKLDYELFGGGGNGGGAGDVDGVDIYYQVLLLWVHQKCII